jgi:aspartate/tyrosine/aromatic aminotransferase
MAEIKDQVLAVCRKNILELPTCGQSIMNDVLFRMYEKIRMNYENDAVYRKELKNLRDVCLNSVLGMLTGSRRVYTPVECRRMRLLLECVSAINIKF